MNRRRGACCWIGAVLVTSGLLSCQSSDRGASTDALVRHVPEAAQGFASGLYWRAGLSPGTRWVILLPGASGLTVFDDDEHYFRAAAELNARGFDVLVIDYKRAYRASSDGPDVPTGEKIAWVVERGVAWARGVGKVGAGEPGAIVAWSLGAEGLWPLLPDRARSDGLGLRAAVAYYPAHDEEKRIATTVPLLVLQGEADDVTPLKELRNVLPQRETALIEVKTFAGAHHGFDVASIRDVKTVRLLPLIGPSGTFGYDAASADAAWGDLVAFLTKHVRP